VYLQELWRRREFAVALGLGNLKARNASTSLGLFWWVLNPMLLGGVYFLIFGILFGGRRPDDFLIYLLSGMFPFHFTSQSMTGGANSIIQNSKLLANLRFPRLLLPISTLIEALVGFLASLVVLMVVVFVGGMVLDVGYFSFRIAYLPFIIGIHLIFNLGLSAVTARLAVPFRDINNLLPYINRIWLYLTPIIWPLSFLDSQTATIKALVRINPMYDIVGLYRSAILGNPIVMDQLVGTLVWAAVIGSIGVALFVKNEGHMVRYL
jgi:teichoic acid transport system permease protein